MAIVSYLDRARMARAARGAHRALMGLPLSVTVVGVGCALVAASSDIANSTDSPRRGGVGPAILLFATLTGAFACFIAAARQGAASSKRSPRRGWARFLIYPILLWSLFTATQTAGILWRGATRALTVTPARYGSDDLYYNHYNAWLVLHGKNPYTGEWLTSEVAYFGDRAYTPIARGQFSNPRHYPTRAQMDAIVGEYLANPHVTPPELDPATTHSYPAGAFLTALPAVWAGAPSIAITQIALFLALLVLIVSRATGRLEALVVALLALATADGARQVTGADFEIWPLAFLVGAWLLAARPRLSAIALGIACAIKQTAWIAAPFYLLWIWRERGRAEAIRRGALALATFLVVNLPWVGASPAAWLRSILLPVSLPLLPDGSGLIGLSLTGALPFFPAWVYSALELVALMATLAWYWRCERRYPYVGLVLPLLPLLAAWRSSERYFELLPIAALAMLALTLRRTDEQVAEEH